MGIAFVSVINTATPALTYSTCLGGATRQESQGFAIALGPSNIVYVTGQTTSSDFPVTANSIPPPGAVRAPEWCSSRCSTPAAQRRTHIRRSWAGPTATSGLGIAADTLGNAYVAGFTGSADFPITQGAILRPEIMGTVPVSSPKSVQVGTDWPIWCTPATSAETDPAGPRFGNAIAMSTTNNAYITGQAASSNLPVTTGAYQQTLTVPPQTRTSPICLCLPASLTRPPASTSERNWWVRQRRRRSLL